MFVIFLIVWQFQLIQKNLNCLQKIIFGLSINSSFDFKIIYTKNTGFIVKKIKIIVGGKSLNEFPNIWKELGVDGYVQTTLDSINLAEGLTKNNK